MHLQYKITRSLSDFNFYSKCTKLFLLKNLCFIWCPCTSPMKLFLAWSNRCCFKIVFNKQTLLLLCSKPFLWQNNLKSLWNKKIHKTCQKYQLIQNQYTISYMLSCDNKYWTPYIELILWLIWTTSVWIQYTYIHIVHT